MTDVTSKLRHEHPDGWVLQSAACVSTCCAPSVSAVLPRVSQSAIDESAVACPVMDGYFLRFLLPRVVSSPLSLNLTTKPVGVPVAAACEYMVQSGSPVRPSRSSCWSSGAVRWRGQPTDVARPAADSPNTSSPELRLSPELRAAS